MPTPFDDTIVGGPLDDIILAQAGNDDVDGGAGNDTFLFENTSRLGHDVIVDFEAGAGSGDLIRLTFVDDHRIRSLFDLRRIAEDDGQDTVIDFGNGNSITLLGVVVADLHEDDFLFS